MFPGMVTAERAPIIQAGLPALNAEMAAADINTPRRIAAFLTTLRFESWCLYNIREIGDTRVYGGRGYIQLTGSANYEAAGKYFGIDLLDTPDLALTLEWSAKIARWYWTVARHCNEMADALQMGKINRAIGYPLSAPGTDGKTNDQRRCDAFAQALRYLTGSVPAGITCTR